MIFVTKKGCNGLGGISDDRQRLCFALALWNGKDQILKERLLGLKNFSQIRTGVIIYFFTNIFMAIMGPDQAPVIQTGWTFAQKEETREETAPEKLPAKANNDQHQHPH